MSGGGGGKVGVDTRETGLDITTTGAGLENAVIRVELLVDRQPGPWHRPPSRSSERFKSISGGGGGKVGVDTRETGLDITTTGAGLENAVIRVELLVDRQPGPWHKPPSKSRERFRSMRGGGGVAVEVERSDTKPDITTGVRTDVGPVRGRLDVVAIRGGIFVDRQFGP
jgi:hypothetical protein